MILPSENSEFMEINLRDLFLRGRWQHLIFLTYSFDLPFFERYLLPILVQRGCRSITIVADAERLAKRLPLWLERRQIQEAGKRYTLCGVKVPGAFHPKMLLAINRKGGVVLIGSGNISLYSMTAGGELFSMVEWDDKQQIPSLAREAWELCDTIARALPIDNRFAMHVHEIERYMPGLGVPPNHRLLRHNLDEPLLEQVFRTVGDRKVTKLLLWAPFFDAKLEALKTIINRLHPKQVTLALQSGITNIDGKELENEVSARPEMGWSFVEIQRKNSNKQMIHAKGMLLTLSSGEDLLLIGSPNISAPALLRTTRDGNVETALLLPGAAIQSQLFSERSSIRFGEPINLQELHWKPDITSGYSSDKTPEMQLLGASLDDSILTLSIHGSPLELAFVILDDAHDGLPIIYSNGSAQVYVPSDPLPYIARIKWGEQLSNPVIIAHLKQLIEQAQKKDISQSHSLDTLVYGGDSELLAFLDQLAALLIIDPYDMQRIAHGLPQPTAEQEAKEAEVPMEPVDINLIDFKALIQKHLSHSHQLERRGSRFTPSLYWLDEINEYFKKLLEQQLHNITAKVDGEDAEDNILEATSSPVLAAQYKPVSKRIRMLLRSRIRRFINGLHFPTFYQIVPPDWIVTNYIRFLNILDFSWKRLKETNLIIFSEDECGDFGLELLTAFWGNDTEYGYWASLDEYQRYEAGLRLIECQADALTLAWARRILTIPGDACRESPFTVAHLYQVGQSLGLFASETAERALVYLEQLDQDPLLLLSQIEEAQKYFSWERYLDKLSKKYDFHKATLKDKGFTTGRALIIDTDRDVTLYPYVLTVFADWIEMCEKQEPDRRIFQMDWGERRDRLVYNADTIELQYRQSGTKNFMVLSHGIQPPEFAKWPCLPI